MPTFTWLNILSLTFALIPNSLSSFGNLKLDSPITKRFVSANNYHGLLNVDVHARTYYSTNINIKKVFEVITSKDYIWNEVIADLKPYETPEAYLKNIISNATQYRFSNKVCGHQCVSDYITQLSLEKGNLITVFGGPSIGKTLLLNNISHSQRHIIYLDGRRSSNTMAVGICQALLDNAAFKDESTINTRSDTSVIKSVAKNITDFFTLQTVKKFKDYFGLPELSTVDVFSALIGSIPKNPGLNEEGSVRGVLQLLKDSSHVSCIIFDDANMFFNENSIKIMELLTAMTKQNKELTVILATSEFDFLQSLSSNGYNTNHFSHHVVMGDPLPMEISQLLASWGIRSHLSNALIDVFGGHVLQIARALEDILLYKQQYVVSKSFISNIDEQISMCIQEAESDPKNYWFNELIDTMHSLAKVGYVPAIQNDVITKLLVKYNIAGYVPFKAYTEHIIPNQLRILSSNANNEDCGHGLIPTTQMVRIAIALKLMKTRRVAFRVAPFRSIKIPRLF